MGARVEVYREGHVAAVGDVVPGKWRWRFYSSNGRILADSGQGYFRRIDALTGCATVLGGDLWRDVDSGEETIGRKWNDGVTLDYGERIPVRDLTREARP